MGLHADSGRASERRPSCGSLDDSPDPHPDAMFMQQTVRTLTMAAFVGRAHGSEDDADSRVPELTSHVATPLPIAERLVQSIKEEGLDRLIPIGDRHVRQAVAE